MRSRSWMAVLSGWTPRLKVVRERYVLGCMSTMSDFTPRRDPYLLLHQRDIQITEGPPLSLKDDMLLRLVARPVRAINITVSILSSG